MFYAFHVLYADGQDLTGEPLDARRGRLSVLVNTPMQCCACRRTCRGSAAEIVHTVRAARLEGVIAKRRHSIYQPGERSNDWVKFELERQQEFVIGGYRPDGVNGLDALLVGYHEGKELRFAGKVRAGLVPHVRREVPAKLRPLRVPDCPFANVPDGDVRRWGRNHSGSDARDALDEAAARRANQFRGMDGREPPPARRIPRPRLDKSASEVRREP